MNDLLLCMTSLTMNSLEIADLVSSEHSKVRQSIERLAYRGAIQLPPMSKVENKQSLSPNNKTAVYLFDFAHKRDTFIVVAQLSPEFTAALVDRWQELESKHSTSTSVATTPPPFKPSFATNLQRYKNTLVVTTTTLAELLGYESSYLLQVSSKVDTLHTNEVRAVLTEAQV